jgi:glycosyltransferase involved in cell wall biosynthesis
MTVFYWIMGCLLALAWLSRIVDAAIGMPTISDISEEKWNQTPVLAPRISIIVPARNEQETIAQVLQHLLALDYENYEVVAVNDRSTDETGRQMESVARDRLRILHIEELPSGWLGKPHAMWKAAQQASGDWLLFTDADVFFRPDVIRRALSYAEESGADHVVLFPRLLLHSVGERIMIAFFQSMFVFGHRPWKVADPKSKDHIGVGAFNLIRRKVYDEIGTYEALRFEVLDDIKLGKVVKNKGFSQRNVFGNDLISLRWGHGARGIVDNVTKNFFAVMSYQTWRMIASSFAVAVLNLMPFAGILLAHGWAKIPFALALSGIFGIYLGMAKRSDFGAYYFLLHPVGAFLFVYAMLRSMTLTIWQDGIVWRGTKYHLDELRKGMV